MNRSRCRRFGCVSLGIQYLPGGVHVLVSGFRTSLWRDIQCNIALDRDRKFNLSEKVYFKFNLMPFAITLTRE